LAIVLEICKENKTLVRAKGIPDVILRLLQHQSFFTGVHGRLYECCGMVLCLALDEQEMAATEQLTQSTMHHMVSVLERKCIGGFSLCNLDDVLKLLIKLAAMEAHKMRAGMCITVNSLSVTL
jgi:hypothetical protein